MVNSIDSRTCLVTGAAGFIGYYLSHKLLDHGFRVIGLDNLNDYYDVSLKETRLERLKLEPRFVFVKGDISSKSEVIDTFNTFMPSTVVNLAAQAGVRYSLENPDAYIQRDRKSVV